MILRNVPREGRVVLDDRERVRHGTSRSKNHQVLSVLTFKAPSVN